MAGQRLERPARLRWGVSSFTGLFGLILAGGPAQSEYERRKMPNNEKISAVAEIVDHFNSSAATLLTDYRGLTVKQISQLRSALGSETTYAVVKNTLTKRAAAEAGVALDETLLVGPTAIAFVKGDPVAAAKGLRDFAKTNPLLIVKGGVYEGRALSATEVSKIADLESREVLLSKVAGVLKALPTRAAGLLQAPLSQVARLAKALEEKTPGDAATADAADAGAADSATADAATADAAAVDSATPDGADGADAGASTEAAPAAEATETSAEPAE
jgi:large subunit ribosomal protein L10